VPLLVGEEAAVAAQCVRPRSPQVLGVERPVQSVSGHNAVDDLQRPAVLVGRELLGVGAGLDIGARDALARVADAERTHMGGDQLDHAGFVAVVPTGAGRLGEHVMLVLVDEEGRGQHDPVSGAPSARHEEGPTLRSTRHLTTCR
jgi:hypothetical protein